jgi:hypothetical protein
MASSMNSAMSGMTVSCFGEDDMDFEEAVDKVFAELQTFVNDQQCGVRTLAMCEERADTYLEALQIWHELDENIAGALNLFSELRSIAKQVLGRPPKDMKVEVKNQLDLWKAQAVAAKAKLKAEAKHEKERANVEQKQ